MRSILLLTLLVAAGAVAVVHSLPEGDAHAGGMPAHMTEHAQTIESISIDSTSGRGLPLARLREAMSSEVGATVDTRKLASDRAALEQVMVSRGYLAAKVSSPVVTFGPSGGVYVVFDVDRGPLFHVRSVALDGEAWNNAVVTLVAGDEVLAPRFERVRQAAEDTLDRHGKHVRVEVDVLRDASEPVVDVRFVAR